MILQHFQRDIVRGVEGFVSASKKQLEIGECGSAFSDMFLINH